jgi:hypothetical protein
LPGWRSCQLVGTCLSDDSDLIAALPCAADCSEVACCHELRESALEGPAGNIESSLELLDGSPVRMLLDRTDDHLGHLQIDLTSHAPFWRDFPQSRQCLSNKYEYLMVFWRDSANRAIKWRGFGAIRERLPPLVLVVDDVQVHDHGFG